MTSVCSLCMSTKRWWLFTWKGAVDLCATWNWGKNDSAPTMTYELYQKYQKMNTTIWNNLLLQRRIVSREGMVLGDHVLSTCGYIRSCK
jgi:hypothetical protein